MSTHAARNGTKNPNPIDKHVGARVRMRRMLLGMSQEKLGDQLGITFQQVQKYENGTNRISASRMVQIGRVLEVPPAFFFEGAPGAGNDMAPLGRGESPEVVDRFVTSADGLALIKPFMKLPPELRRSFTRCVEQAAVALK